MPDAQAAGSGAGAAQETREAPGEDIHALAAQLAARHEQHPARHPAPLPHAPLPARAAALLAGAGSAARAFAQGAAPASAASPSTPFTPADPAARAPVLTPGLARCETHGDYPLNAIDADGTLRWHSPGCPACRRVRAAQGLLARAAVDPRFAHCRFKNYIAQTPAQRANLDACRDYARDFARHRAAGTCLILRGNPGTGKNHLAAALTRSLIARGHSVLNATVWELVRRMRDAWGRGGAGFGAGLGAGFGAGLGEAALLRELANLDLLIIDEVGRTHLRADGSAPPELFQVIDARYRAMRPTAVISNCPREHLAEALGDAAFDRLREGSGLLLNFDWPSYRGQAQFPSTPSTPSTQES